MSNLHNSMDWIRAKSTVIDGESELLQISFAFRLEQLSVSVTTLRGLVLIFANKSSFTILKHQVGFSFFFVHDHFIEFRYVGMIDFF